MHAKLRSTLRKAATALIVAVGLSGCEFTRTPQSFLAPEGVVARMQSELFMLSVWLMGGILIVVTALLVYALWRFRDRQGRELPFQNPGNHRFELVWTIVPTVLVILLAVPSVRTAYTLATPPPEDETLVVDVTGYQFWWKFEYPQLGIVTANELHVPANRPVQFTLRSADVIHSFWFPRLAGKMDVNPGKVTTVWWTADREGVYLGQCAEYCGTSHANMRLRATAHSESEFEAWVQSMKAAQERTPPESTISAMASTGPIRAQAQPGGAVSPDEELIDRGREIFASSACAACHTLADAGTSGDVGPNLNNFGARETLAAGIYENTPENLKRWITRTQEMKPGVIMPALPFSEEDLEALTTYLLSLK